MPFGPGQPAPRRPAGRAHPGGVGDQSRRASRRAVGAPGAGTRVEGRAREGRAAHLAAVRDVAVGARQERPGRGVAPRRPAGQLDRSPAPVDQHPATEPLPAVGADPAAEGRSGGRLDPGPVDRLRAGEHLHPARARGVPGRVVGHHRVGGRLSGQRVAVAVRRPADGPDRHPVAEHAVARDPPGVARRAPADDAPAAVGGHSYVGRLGRRSGVDRNDVVEVDELVGVAAHARADGGEVEAVVAVGVHLRDQDGAAAVDVLDVGDVAALVPADRADGRVLVGLVADALGDLAPLGGVAPVPAGVPVGERQPVAHRQAVRHPRGALALQEAAGVADAAGAEGALVAVRRGRVRVAVARRGMGAEDPDPALVAERADVRPGRRAVGDRLLQQQLGLLLVWTCLVRCLPRVGPRGGRHDGEQHHQHGQHHGQDEHRPAHGAGDRVVAGSDGVHGGPRSREEVGRTSWSASNRAPGREWVKPSTRRR